MIKLEKGDKIEIFGDYFIVGDTFNSKIELLTKDPKIIYVELERTSNKIVLFIQREIDCDLKAKSFRYNQKKYQIINQIEKEEYRGGKWERFIESEVYVVGRKDEYARVIVSQINGKSIFTNWEKVKEEEIIFNPLEGFEIKKENNKKIKIKFKDLP